MYDILIVGAGIVGCFLAHDLSKKELKVAVFDREADVANKATMANSAIIHSGHDPLDNTLKAKLNVRGNEMYESICKDLGVSFKRTSAFVAATSMEEEDTLDMLYQQTKNRNIPVMYLTKEEAIKKEPNLSDHVTKVIELPTTGIVYPWEVAIALAEEASENNVDFYLNEQVEKIKKTQKGFEVITSKGNYEAKIIINAAGVCSDKIYGKVSSKVDFEITPRKGEYFVLDKLKKPLVSRVIYPVPSSAGKGVLVVPTTHGNVLLGPNSEMVDSGELNNNTKDSLDYVKKEIHKTVKNIPMDKVIHSFAGVRPTSTRHDFIIEEAKDVTDFINVAGIESPGLASAPAISEYVINEILSKKIRMNEKNMYTKRRPNIKLKEMTEEEKNELVKKNPAFGKIVCRCEQITEGEIIDAIRRPLGATTVKGIKKRVRPGMGRCQGGFCEPLVVDILARERKISPLEVRLDGDNSVMLMEETKE
ncbi:glycerol-3-phosphate dehydrogenase [Lachnotalea glycerini]|uniref:FAD/NAD(P)-binding oxidoreductase n=1 Tax=Lachnotalea glycerini TaxID=1763509 RepID=A0A318ELS7_9FIRM|nr:NAD(P)/FAD-dependent oxidoreductase [Lachnotalea glycerini]PXV89035.1 glycerol-3-phosphate dehydrogenase [Lachnotalea glycerini]RDY31507.1 FAD/NAD(P)-binding oxidoreductase [Lachnotalea glycerini]